MKTRKQNLDYEQLLARCRGFVELLPLYLRCTDRVQAVVLDMVTLMGSPDTTEEDRERACGTVAGALLAFAPDEEELSADRTFRLPIPPETKAQMGQQQHAFAERLKALRLQKGWTQEELARRSGVGQSAISTLENGQCRPQVGTLVKLAKALGIAKNDLWPVTPQRRNGQLEPEQRPANGQAAKTREAEKTQ